MSEVSSASQNDLSVLDTSMGLSIRVSRIGTRKKVSAAQAVEAGIAADDVDQDLIHVAKEILDSQELRDIKQCDSELLGKSGWLTRRCLPSMFRAGIYLIPMPMVEQVDARLTQWQEVDRPPRIEAFLTTYPARIEQAQARLGTLFNEGDYPDPEILRGKFGVQTHWMSLGVPGQLQKISAKLFQHEQEKAKALWAERTEQLNELLCLELAGLADNLVQRLAPGEDGSVRVIKDASLNQIRQWLDVFQEGRTVPDDGALKQQVETLNKVLHGLDPEEMRCYRNVRVQVCDTMAQVRDMLEAQIQESRGRRIRPLVTDDAS
jgi:hypothetical protein